MTIFKKFFKPKWQHKDPVIRVQALQQLNDLSILDEIASRDIEASVRRKALEKLASFSAWARAMKQEPDQHLQKLAQEKVKLAILNEDSKLACSESEKRAFLVECKQVNLIEDVIRRSNDSQLRLELLANLNKESLDLDLVMRDKDQDIALFCFNRLTNVAEVDVKLLERIAQKANHPSIRQQAATQLEQLKADLQKPIKLKKELTLLLSKLLALKDKQDYLLLMEQGEALVKEWQQHLDDFSCLTQDEQQTYKTKYEQICQRLETATAGLKEAYLTQQSIQAAAEFRKQTIENTQAELASIQQKVNQAIEHTGDETQQEILNLIHQTKLNLEQSHLTGSEIEALFNELNRYETNVQNLSEFSEQVSQATIALTQLTQLELFTGIDDFDEKSTAFNQWFKQWKQIKRDMLFPLPESLLEGAQSLIKQWQTELKQVETEQSKKIKRISFKIRELQGLITAGKYNAAFGLFRKMSEWHDELTHSNKVKIERDFQKMNEKIAELEDWKAYIGLPRKQEIVNEIKTLVESPLDDPQEQAKKIKLARHTWQLLGNVDSEENNLLNTEFNQLSELAFAPCRAYYAELEAQRAVNLTAKQALIEQLTQISQAEMSSADLNNLGKQLHSLQNQWNEIGPVDREIYQQVNKSFYDLLDPLKNKVSQFQRDNAQQKNAIIVKATQLVEENDDIDAVSETLKSLQTEWKKIGFAGAHKENRLWNKFRAINDQVFKQKQHNYEADKIKRNALFEQVNELMNTYSLKLAERISQADLAVLAEDIKAIDLQTLNKHQADKISRQQDKLLKQIEQKQQQFANNKVLNNYRLLFEALEQSQHTDMSQIEFPSQWQSVIEAGMAQDTAANQIQQNKLMIQMEISAGIESPTKDAEQRMSLQVQMLSDKLNSGGLKSLDELLAQWISLGIPTESESVERVKNAVFSAY